MKLKPCPFCGGEAAYIAQNYMGQHYVRCPYCGCTMWGLDTDEEVTEKQAAACWNKRADVRPVVRGKWIDHQEGRWIYAKCSECETVHDVRSNFCPDCGADMRPEPPEEVET